MATPMLNCCSFQKGMYLPNGVGPTDSCPLIIQTVADILDAVAGTVEGQLTVERYVDVSENQHIHLYEWNGVTWVELIDTSFKPTDGLFDTLTISFIGANYEVSVTQGTVWEANQSDYAIDPPQATVEVWFRNVQTGCIYSNIPQIPLAIYCVAQGSILASDPLFFFGSINGVQADDTANVLATYANWQGNTTTITTITPQADISGSPYFVVTMIYDSVTTPPTDLGLYVNPFVDPPVAGELIHILTTSCVRNCYEAIFTVNDIDLDGVTELTSSFGSSIDTDEIPFSDPTWGAQYLALMIANNFVEPTATLTTSNNGNEVTLIICSVIPMASGSWSNDDGTISGPITFTLI